MKSILFRVDSSSDIGTGHIMRDLVLATHYKDSRVIFAVQNLEGNINHKIVESGYQVEILQSNDIEEIYELSKNYKIDMIVIDHYEIDFKYEIKLKKMYPKVKILTLDDTYERHHCDIVLNHNISADKKRYKGLVPEQCEIRCGSKYTLLREEFYTEKKKKRVFLAMGGSDHSNVNISILEVLKEFKNIEVNLVTTDANKNLQELKKYIQNREWIRLHINSKQIALLMKQSDLAIITPSVILNEVYFMGLVFIAIKTADNQKEIYKYLKENRFLVLKKFDVKKLFRLLKTEIDA